MSKTEANGRIKLTWAQIVWGLTTFGMLAGLWTRMEVRTALILVSLGAKADTSEVRNIDRDLREHLRWVPAARAGRRQ